MIHILQVYILYKIILAARTYSAKGVFTWAVPVIRLFDLTFSSWIHDFWYPVCTRLNESRLCPVSSLGQALDYCHSVILILIHIFERSLRVANQGSISWLPQCFTTSILHTKGMGWTTQAIGLATTFRRPFDFSTKRIIYSLRWYNYGCVSVCVYSYTSRGLCPCRRCLLKLCGSHLLFARTSSRISH